MIWSEFKTSTAIFISQLHSSNNFSDMTLSCEDAEHIPAHRVILSAGSSFFNNLLNKSRSDQHPLIYLRGVPKEHLEEILSFLYKGEASVQKTKLDSFLALARDLGVAGFAEEEDAVKEEDSGGGVEHSEKVSTTDISFDTDNHIMENQFLNDQFKEESVPQRVELQEPNEEKENIWKLTEKFNVLKSICNLCGSTFGNENLVRRHLLNQHSDSPNIVKFMEENERNPKYSIPKHTKALVWRHFRDNKDGETVSCFLCSPRKVNIKIQAASTKSPRTHLSSYHKEEWKNIEREERERGEKEKEEKEREVKEKQEEIQNRSGQSVGRPPKDPRQSIPKNTKALVWKHFVDNEDGETVYCLLCRPKIFKMKIRNSSTKSPRVHLASYHKKEWKDIEKEELQKQIEKRRSEVSPEMTYK